MWTGTHGVLQLEDVNGNLVDIYLGTNFYTPIYCHSYSLFQMTLVWRRFLSQGKPRTIEEDMAKGEMSLVRFFWKIVYDENSKRGIAVVGTNNIHRSGIDNRSGT